MHCAIDCDVITRTQAEQVLHEAHTESMCVLVYIELIMSCNKQNMCCRDKLFMRPLKRYVRVL